MEFLAEECGKKYMWRRPRWKNVTLHFAAKVFYMAGISLGDRGHYERLHHERN